LQHLKDEKIIESIVRIFNCIRLKQY